MSTATGERVAVASTLVVFGATGDLAHRKLYPALGSLAMRGQLPRRVHRHRRRPDRDDRRRLRRRVPARHREGARRRLGTAARHRRARPPVPVRRRLVRRRRHVRAPGRGGPSTRRPTARAPRGNALYYLATVPTDVRQGRRGARRRSGLATRSRRGRSAASSIEKPFGHDLETAADARPPAAPVLRRAPDLPHRPLPGQGDRPEHPGPAVREHDLRAAVEPPLRRPRARSRWPSRSASSTAARSTSRPGALRDIVQNHLLQVLALVGDGAAGVVRRRRHPRREGEGAALDPPAATRRSSPSRVVRGQYARGTIDGVRRPGVPRRGGRGAPTARPRRSSRCELDIDNWRWAGVPFYLRTGKRLPRARHRGRAPLHAGAVPAAATERGRHRSSRTRWCSASSPTRASRSSFAAKVPGAEFRVRERRPRLPLRGGVRRGAPRRRTSASSFDALPRRRRPSSSAPTRSSRRGGSCSRSSTRSTPAPSRSRPTRPGRGDRPRPKSCSSSPWPAASPTGGANHERPGRAARRRRTCRRRSSH